VLADDLAALAECVDVAVRGGDGVQRRPGYPHQVEPDPQEVLGDDVQVGGREEVVDVGHPPGDRVVDRDHRQVGVPALDRGEDVLERRAGQRLPVGIVLLAHLVGVGPGLALIGDTSSGHDQSLRSGEWRS
jgi:hypothetical protein